jgi:hypothetical protein
MKFIRDIKAAKARGATMRPIWQILLLLPVYPVYLGARAFVDFMDNHI